MTQQTINLEFPLYTVQDEGSDKTHTPFALEVSRENNSIQALLFTSEDAVRRYAWRKGLTIQPREIPSKVEMNRHLMLLMTRLPAVQTFCVDPTGGVGVSRIATVRDVAIAMAEG